MDHVAKQATTLGFPTFTKSHLCGPIPDYELKIIATVIIATVTCLNVAEPRVDNVHSDTNVCVNAVKHILRFTPFASKYICPCSGLDALLDFAEDLSGETGNIAV